MEFFKGKKIIAFIVVIVIFIIYIFYFFDRSEKQYKQFYKSDIQGILTNFNSTSSGVYITVSYSNKYNFSYKSGERFPYIAEEGDSIIKTAFADTIILKKPTGEIYRFTFMKH